MIQDINDGRLKDAGLKKGFIITHIDKAPIKSKKQLIDLLKSKKGGILIEGKYQNGVKGYFGFGL
jgi:S1-C subfamily serine protease